MIAIVGKWDQTLKFLDDYSIGPVIIAIEKVLFSNTQYIKNTMDWQLTFSEVKFLSKSNS